jgi:hypothetical protein
VGAFQGIAMRTSTWAIFLFVSLKGITSVSAALAAPAEAPQPVVPPAIAVARLGTDAQRTAPLVPADHERKPEPIQGKTLSRDFSSPKPVKIYWFFGGR